MAFFRRTRGRRHDARRAKNTGAARTHGNGILPQAPEGEAYSMPPLPHEHDQSTTSEIAGEPEPKLRQAKRDIESGVLDTDRRSAYGLSDGLSTGSAGKPGHAVIDPELARREKKKAPA